MCFDAQKNRLDETIILEHTKHIFWLRNHNIIKKKEFNLPNLIWEPMKFLRMFDNVVGLGYFESKTNTNLFKLRHRLKLLP